MTPTTIRFCHATWQLQSPVQRVELGSDYLYVVTEQTPFHPVSHIWPDHPADRGYLNAHPVLDCQVGAVELGSNELYVGQAIPVKRDEPGWVFVVVHCLAKEVDDVHPSQCVELKVDKAHQQALSRGHSAGHLAYLALNKVLVEQQYWRKDAERKDPHGNYDFNSYAQVTSFVTPDRCTDHYRLGKTLRKRGLNSSDVLANLSDIESRVNRQLGDWLSLGAPIHIQCHGEKLTDSRYWQCDLGEGSVAQIPCGGTHAQSLREFAAIEVSVSQVDQQHIEMLTQVRPQ
ncbi:alanyl-tRNA editing protein [Vibrio sinaloensis]|uniref:alanyl-tRNA editing protein n=1 Tax=Photobacterium sp. (strain ATCC 43367) TaxID=379097 RepID=UPI002059899F|nr:alanyl-tRNA editing protein [Vibrio sinaloensis]UPQ87397.1 alanyl-tRNA editing protein [Vibrio sinaloensis]